MSRNTIACLLVIAIVAGCSAKREAEEAPRMTRLKATPQASVTDGVDRDPDILTLLYNEEFADVAARIYIPPAYREAGSNQIRDRMELALNSLVADLGELGDMSPIANNDEVSCYVAQVGAPPDDEPTVSVARYRVEYQHGGPGVLFLEYVRPERDYVLRRMMFGLDAYADDSRARMIAAIENMLEAVGSAYPGLRRDLEASLRPRG